MYNMGTGGLIFPIFRLTTNNHPCLFHSTLIDQIAYYVLTRRILIVKVSFFQFCDNVAEVAIIYKPIYLY
jgi:hypothetical protein